MTNEEKQHKKLAEDGRVILPLFVNTQTTTNKQIDMENYVQYFEAEGYTNIVKKDTKVGICGIYRFAFTTGLVIGMKLFEYYGRYCYNTRQEAVDALEKWDGNGDPPGDWIKYKGYGGERWNPNNKKEEYEKV